MTHYKSFVLFWLIEKPRRLFRLFHRTKTWWYIYLGIFLYFVFVDAYLIATLSFIAMVIMSIYKSYVSGEDVYWYRQKRRYTSWKKVK